MDISETTAPRSDQQNFDDYATGPRTVTITEVRSGSSEQPVELHLAEFPGRPYKPSKSMRRVLVAAWGPDSSVYLGRRLTLIGDPTVKFGGTAVGGIKIAALSNIDGRLTVNLTVTKGKRAPHVVDSLPDAPTPPTETAIACATDKDQLREWHRQFPALRESILARVAEIDAQPTEDGAHS